MGKFIKDKQYIKFCSYGFLKNLRFFDAFFLLFLLEKEMSYSQIGVLYAVREIVINLVEIPSGLIADSYGRKNALLGSFLLYIISFSVFYSATNFWLFLIAFSFYGMGDAFRSGTHKGMIMDYLRLNGWGGQKVAYYGNTRSWSQKGSAISALVAGLIVFYSGSYQSIFLYAIVPYFINFLIVFSYPSAINLPQQKKTNKGLKIGNAIQTLANTIKEPAIFNIVSTSAIHTAYLSAIKDYIQPLMVNIALIIPFMLAMETEKKNGLVIGAIYFIIYLLSSKASQFSSKIATKKHISHLTLSAGVSAGILCGILYTKEWWWLALVPFIGIYLIENIRKPVLTGFIADNVPSEILTSVISAQSLLKTIITAILAYSFGFFADRFGIGFSFVIISSFLLLISFILNLLWRFRFEKLQIK